MVAVTDVVLPTAVMYADPHLPPLSILIPRPTSDAINPCPLLIPVTADAVIVTLPEVAEAVNVVLVVFISPHGPSIASSKVNEKAVWPVRLNFRV